MRPKHPTQPWLDKLKRSMDYFLVENADPPPLFWQSLALVAELDEFTGSRNI